MQTVSARELQRELKKTLEKANKIDEPIIIISQNKPRAVLIGLDLLEKILSQKFNKLRKTFLKFNLQKNIRKRQK